MKVRILVIAAVLGALSFQTASSLSAQTAPNTLRNFRLRVSGVSNDAVRVRGAVWMDGSSTNVVIVDQQTPFELDTFGNVLNGILASMDGRDAIRVQVTDETTGSVTLAAEGHSIVVGQGLTENPEWAFIKIAR